MKASDLTEGEKLLLDRRRRGRSQRQRAAELGVTLYQYRAWEGDRERPESIPRLGSLSVAEVCVVARRRAAIGVVELANELGVSREWLRQMEAGNVDPARLASYWQQAGIVDTIPA